MLRLLPAMILAATAMLAQVGTASRVVTLPPEEIVVEIVISTATDLYPDQAAALLAPLRIATQDMKSVGTLRDDVDRLGWQYTIVRPYHTIQDTVRQLDFTRRQLRDAKVPMTYQFYLRPSAATLDAAKRRVLSELVSEARRTSGAGGKLRSLTVEPRPEHIDSGRTPLLFGQPAGNLQYSFTVVAVFE